MKIDEFVKILIENKEEKKIEITKPMLNEMTSKKIYMKDILHNGNFDFYYFVEELESLLLKTTSKITGEGIKIDRDVKNIDIIYRGERIDFNESELEKLFSDNVKNFRLEVFVIGQNSIIIDIV